MSLTPSARSVARSRRRAKDAPAVFQTPSLLAAMTAKHRADHGSQVVRLNPFNAFDLGSDGFNPVASLDTASDDFADDAMGLAEAMIRVEGREPHWSQSAQDLVCALIMYVRLVLPNPSLADVRTLLGQGSDDFRRTVLAREIEYAGRTIPGMIATAIIRDCPELETKASRFGDITPDNRELTSIMSAALTQTRWLDSRPVKADLAKGAFVLADNANDSAPLDNYGLLSFNFAPKPAWSAATMVTGAVWW